MYLWQIRHIPFSSQSRFIFTPVLLAGVVIVLLASRFVSDVWGQSEKNENGQASSPQKTPSPGNGSGKGDVVGGADSGPTSSAKPLGVDRGPQAAAFFAKVQSRLREREIVRCLVEQTVAIGDQRFKASGRYLSSGSKLRLEYVVKPDQGLEGSLVEVCDGKDLWSLMTFAKTKRVTHRDVQLIKEAAMSQRGLPDATITSELGLGGLNALFASLERTMVFDLVKHEEINGKGRSIVQGAWKPEVTSRWRRKSEDPLPPYIPDQVRLYVDSATMFPERIVYLKRYIDKEKKESLRSMVSLEFKSIEFDVLIDDQEFTFVTPEDVVPEDITRQYIDRITKGAEAAGNAPKNAGETSSPNTTSPVKSNAERPR